MLNYSVKLTTVEDFRNYANMIYRFHIGGHVLIGSEKIYISSFLEIMSHCPQYNMPMILNMYREEEVPALEEYMRETGLTGKENCNAA